MTISCSCQVCRRSRKAIRRASAAERKATAAVAAARARTKVLELRLREVTKKVIAERAKLGEMTRSRDFYKERLEQMCSSLDDGRRK
jgi:hypothetical protein